MKKDNHPYEIVTPFVTKKASIDVQLSAEVEKNIQELTSQKFEQIKDTLEHREPEALPEFRFPKREVGQKNLLYGVTVKDNVFMQIAVFFALLSETVLMHNIFEKVLGFSPEKSLLGALGFTALLFTSAILFKPLVIRFLRTKKIMPKLFKIAVIVYCFMLFLLGGLSFYITDVNSERETTVFLIDELEELKDELEENPTDSTLIAEVGTKQKAVDEKLDTINNRPLFIKIISFLTLSIMSVVMLFCSSFLKAVTSITSLVVSLKKKRDKYQKIMTEKQENYKSSISRIMRAYSQRNTYLLWVIRKTVIEELLALMPSTKEYKAPLLKNDNTSLNGAGLQNTTPTLTIKN